MNRRRAWIAAQLLFVVALVVFLGFALIFDWLGMFSRSLAFLWPNV